MPIHFRSSTSGRWASKNNSTLAWPLLVLALRKPNRWKTAIWLVGTISVAFSVWLAGHREFDFYSPLTRAWELMAGALLVWRTRYRPSSASFPPLAQDSAVAAGLLLIVASCFLFGEALPYPGWRAALPVAGAMLLIVAGDRSRLGALLLANRFAVFVGLINYPLYLLHWPLLVFATAVKFLPLTLLERGLVVAISYALAWVIYRHVERPLRLAPIQRRWLALLGGTMAAAGVCGFVIVQGHGFESRFPPELTAHVVRDTPSAWRVHQCLLDLDAGQRSFVASCVEDARPLIAIWGDSTAGALMPGFRKLQSRTSFGLAQFTANSCAPIQSATVSRACRENNRAVLDSLKRLRPDVVVLHAFGPLDKDTLEGWRTTVTALIEDASRVIVLGPVPAWKRALPDQFLSHYITRRRMLPLRSTRFVDNLWDDQTAKSLFEGLGAEYISAWEILCNAEGCLTRVTENGPLTAIDGAHLTEPGSALLVNAMADQLLRSQSDAPH